MWIDADNLWAPANAKKLTPQFFQAAFAIGYSENECIEARFPANNPITGVPEIVVSNPMTPNNPNSFWSTMMRPYLRGASANLMTLVASVDDLYSEWGRLFGRRTELPISDKSYLLDDMPLTLSAGIVQIRDYARDTDNQTLLRSLSRMQEVLKSVKRNFFELVTSSAGLNYFGTGQTVTMRTLKFEQALVPVPSPKKVASVRQTKRRVG